MATVMSDSMLSSWLCLNCRKDLVNEKSMDPQVVVVPPILRTLTRPLRPADKL